MLIEAYAVKALIQNSCYDLEYRAEREAMQRDVDELPAVEAVPIKPLCAWLSDYCVPPGFSFGDYPVDSAEARAEGWETHIRALLVRVLQEVE